MTNEKLIEDIKTLIVQYEKIPDKNKQIIVYIQSLKDKLAELTDGD
jgi:hypothetical protein